MSQTPSFIFSVQSPLTNPHLNADLHNHTIASDGKHTAAEVVAFAAANNTTLLALTDHDTTDALAEAAIAASHAGIAFVPGVEISVTWRGHTIHIVGLGIDAANPVLMAGLASIRSGRIDRAKLMGNDFAKMGLPGVFEGAMSEAPRPEMIGRTHFARHLVKRGVVKDMGAAFSRFLTTGKVGYVEHDWASLENALRWIAEAGGVPVLAHPGRYKMTSEALTALVRDFKMLGGIAIEVVTGSHTPQQFGIFSRMAREYGFEASRGADFHAVGESPYLPGTLPPLPESLTPVWHRWPALTHASTH